jgi:F0F1-type ATP synthase membrane subunit b/b'
MENKEKEIVDLVKQVIQLKTELKSTAAGYREEIKELEKQISDLIDEAAEKNKIKCNNITWEISIL